jgi:acyl-CoA thioester hydrolase
MRAQGKREATMPSTDVEQPDLTKPGLYSRWTKDIVRYGDTDRQGHVNNAVFATFLESGRVAILHAPDKPLAPPGASFVIARLVLDFRAEIQWPGAVDIGSLVLRVGTSSVTLGQGIFVGNRCVATAETVIVLMDETTRKSRPLPDAARSEFGSLGVDKSV